MDFVTICELAVVVALALLVAVRVGDRMIRRKIQKERQEIVEIVKGYKPLSPNPDVVYTKKAILAAIEKRNHRERNAKN